VIHSDDVPHSGVTFALIGEVSEQNRPKDRAFATKGSRALIFNRLGQRRALYRSFGDERCGANSEAHCTKSRLNLQTENLTILFDFLCGAS
jgi:hypothetical protein